MKGLYENFYKVYNAKAADRLGVVYTPGEIVRFMIRSADWLCEKHFGKNLIDSGVEILDPATGTGTFIVELLESFRGHPEKLRHKYKQELHANEVAILPYYVANLNIEATYQAITGQFAEFENLCLVDTLDNVDALGIHSGHQFDLLGSLSDENIERIKRQNRRKISVIIGNPPYNANQQNENDNNKNRAYAHIDKRIKNTYVKASTAQKTKLYDMYARFYRWASDRLGDEGVLAFVTNRSFIESRTFDGFRKIVAEDFNEIWVIDLGGDVRANPRLSGTKHNVFGIQTGVAVCFLVRRSAVKDCAIRYVRRPEEERAEDKLRWLGGANLKDLQTTLIKPSKMNVWVNQGDEHFATFLPIASKEVRASEIDGQKEAIFGDFSLGASTNRDEWVVDINKNSLIKKIVSLSRLYRDARKTKVTTGLELKWSSSLKTKALSGRKDNFLKSNFIKTLYRPFTRRWLYDSNVFVDRRGGTERFFPLGKKNPSLVLLYGDRQPFSVLGSAILPNLNVYSADPALYLPKWSGERIDNITDWALNKFIAEYGKKPISKDAIFHYVYAVLHDPLYRETYALNLKREFPRIPFYPDFARWAAWGEALMALHIGYEDVEPWPVERIETPQTRAKATQPKPILKSYPDKGVVVIDADTQITGIPKHAWDYRLGNRSAIDWVLDQHKEKKPRDPTIAAKFNTYRFADYKEQMITLLAKVVRVSIETVAITTAMKTTDRTPP